MSDEINICGVLVHGKPDQAPQIISRLEQIPGTEVHHTTSDGKFIITIEGETEQQAGERMLDLSRTEGVLSASLVYHHFEKGTDSQAQVGESP